MSALTYTTKFTLATVLLPLCGVSLWMIAAPGAVAISPSTYATLATLLLTIAFVALETRRGRAGGSIGERLHQIDTAQSTTHRRSIAAADANRSEWRS